MRNRWFLLLVVALLAICTTVVASQAGARRTSDGPAVGRGPKLPAETAVFSRAEKFVDVGTSFILEGPSFDRTGKYLYFVKPTSLYRVAISTREVETLLESPNSGFAATDVSKDGRIYLASLLSNAFGPGNSLATAGPGNIISVDSSGGDPQTIISSTPGNPVYPDDLVFDSKGALYWTNMKGDALHPEGSVMLTSPDFASTGMLADGFAMPNGIDIAPDGRSLWVNEYATNRVLLLELNADGTALSRFPFGGGIEVAHTLQGRKGVDSLTVDSAGNVYVAFHGQESVYVLAPDGKLLEIVRTPGFNDPTNIAIQPGTSKAYVTATDSRSGKAAILRFDARAPAKSGFAQQ